MGHRRILALLLFIFLAVATAATEKENKTASIGGIFWSAGKGENKMLNVMESKNDEESSSVNVEDRSGDEFAGGFSTMEGMLQWAIGHSDPETLKERAEEAKKLSEDGLKKRQLEIKELMERLKMPSDAELMKIAIADLNNSSISLEDRQRALNELLFLVEPIDNAKDLDKLGGLVAVIRELHNYDSGIRMTSAWILGKASQNNPLVQNQVLAQGALKELIKMVNSGLKEEAVKALFALSALIRNNKVGLELFCSEKGNAMLQNLMNDRSLDIRLRRKAAFLVSDLADYKLQYDESAELPFLSDRDFLKAVVDLLSTSDLDLQEKALLAIRSLLQLTSTEASDFQDFCDLDGVLERTRESLSNLMQDEDHAEYVEEIEALRREVYNIFHMKINRVPWVPT